MQRDSLANNDEFSWFSAWKIEYITPNYFIKKHESQKNDLNFHEISEDPQYWKSFGAKEMLIYHEILWLSLAFSVQYSRNRFSRGGRSKVKKIIGVPHSILFFWHLLLRLFSVCQLLLGARLTRKWLPD